MLEIYLNNLAPPARENAADMPIHPGGERMFYHAEALTMPKAMNGARVRGVSDLRVHACVLCVV